MILNHNRIATGSTKVASAERALGTHRVHLGFAHTFHAQSNKRTNDLAFEREIRAQIAAGARGTELRSTLLYEFSVSDILQNNDD